MKIPSPGLLALTCLVLLSAPVIGSQKTATEVVRSAGKMAAPVSLTHRLHGKAGVGQALRLELVLNTREPDRMAVEISGDDALALQSPVTRAAVRSGQSLFVVLTPQVEGRYYVNVIASLSDAQRAPAKVFSIPVQVGAPGSRRPANKANLSQSGELLIRMKAAEQIRRTGIK